VLLQLGLYYCGDGTLEDLFAVQLYFVDARVRPLADNAP
jgi:hypothetical protein